MFHTGLSRYKTATFDNFTTDIGIKLRRKLLNKAWRKILSLCTKRKVIVERYPVLNKDEVYILQGSTEQMEHNPIFLAMWLNGMIYLDRTSTESRKDAIKKMKRILTAGSSILLFPEGGYNNTENQLIQPLFSSPYILSKELGIKVVPLITFNDIGTDEIYVRVGEPIDLSVYEKWEAMCVLRDVMSTIVFEIIEEHVKPIKRAELPDDSHKWWLEVRKAVYDCQKWSKDVWEEELTYYPGHGVTTPKQAREFVDKVNVNKNNAYIFSDMLIRREEDKKYDLVKYLQENMKYAK